MTTSRARRRPTRAELFEQITVVIAELDILRAMLLELVRTADTS